MREADTMTIPASHCEAVLRGMSKRADKEGLRQRLEKHSIPVTESGCWIWMGAIRSRHRGYGCIRFNGTTVQTHRAAWMVSYGLIPQGKQVLHKCDVRCCVNPDHLFLGTNADNVQDKVKKGRAHKPKGEANPNVKLTSGDVLLIRCSPLNGPALASQFGVTRTQINRIRRGQGWSHLL